MVYLGSGGLHSRLLAIPYSFATLVMDDKEASVSLLKQFTKKKIWLQVNKTQSKLRCGLKKQLYLPVIIGVNILVVALYGIVWDLLFGVLDGRSGGFCIYQLFVLTPTLVWIGTRSDFFLPKIISKYDVPS